MANTEASKVVYLTGCVPGGDRKPEILSHAGRADLGVLITPDTKQYRQYIETFGGIWAADNACFSQAKPWVETEDMSSWKEQAWLRFLDEMLPWIDSCLWATIPDVVGDHEGTLARWSIYRSYVAERGYRPAFVGQNGATPETLPWDEMGALFLGGSRQCTDCGWIKPVTMPEDYRLDLKPEGRVKSWILYKLCLNCGVEAPEWKESPAALALVREAQRRGLPVHMGRTNGVDRLQLAQDWGIDTGDGTYMISGAIQNVISWLDEVNGAPVEPVPQGLEVAA